MRNFAKFTAVVTSYDQDFLADIARVKLLTAKIPCEIANNSVFRWNPFSAKVGGTYTILVRGNDLNKARKILKSR